MPSSSRRRSYAPGDDTRPTILHALDGERDVGSIATAIRLAEKTTAAPGREKDWTTARQVGRTKHVVNASARDVSQSSVHVTEERAPKPPQHDISAQEGNAPPHHCGDCKRDDLVAGERAQPDMPDDRRNRRNDDGHGPAEQNGAGDTEQD
jgi:hypothetical protein